MRACGHEGAAVTEPHFVSVPMAVIPPFQHPSRAFACLHGVACPHVDNRSVAAVGHRYERVASDAVLGSPYEARFLG